MFGPAQRARPQPGDFAACSGCNLCLLVCPVWRRTHDFALTPHGRAKALLFGATAADIAPSVESCTLCTACEPVCPENIGLVAMTLELRRQLAQAHGLQALRASMDEQAALPPPAKPAAANLLLRHLRLWLPQAQLAGLGMALSSLPRLRRALGAGDLYVIEPRASHADYQRLVGHYDALRAASGCALNLDLQRIAIPAAARSLPQRLGLETIDDSVQLNWILQGHQITRIVVESLEDGAAFAEVSKLRVVHLADLADDATS